MKNVITLKHLNLKRDSFLKEEITCSSYWQKVQPTKVDGSSLFLRVSNEQHEQLNNLFSTSNTFYTMSQGSGGECAVAPSRQREPEGFRTTIQSVDCKLKRCQFTSCALLRGPSVRSQLCGHNWYLCVCMCVCKNNKSKFSQEWLIKCLLLLVEVLHLIISAMNSYTLSDPIFLLYAFFNFYQI